MDRLRQIAEALGTTPGSILDGPPRAVMPAEVINLWERIPVDRRDEARGLLEAAGAQTEWVRVASTAPNTPWFVSKTDLSNEVNYQPTIWIKVDGSRDKSVKWRTWMMQVRFDCNNQTYTSLADLLYDAQGGVTSSKVFAPYEQEARPIPPETAMLRAAQRTCPSRSIP